MENNNSTPTKNSKRISHLFIETNSPKSGRPQSHISVDSSASQQSPIISATSNFTRDVKQTANSSSSNSNRTSSQLRNSVMVDDFVSLESGSIENTGRLLAARIPDTLEESHESVGNQSDLVHNMQMSQILPGLYLGSEKDSKNFDNLVHKHIFNILCVSQEAGRMLAQDARFKYHVCPIKDTINSNLSDFLPNAIQFIDRAICGGENILIHCSYGVSRSPAFLAAYLIKTYGLTVDQALAIIKRNRQIVNPNVGFLMQLKEFEEATLQQSQVIPQTTTVATNAALDSDLDDILLNYYGDTMSALLVTEDASLWDGICDRTSKLRLGSSNQGTIMGIGNLNVKTLVGGLSEVTKQLSTNQYDVILFDPRIREGSSIYSIIPLNGFSLVDKVVVSHIIPTPIHLHIFTAVSNLTLGLATTTSSGLGRRRHFLNKIIMEFLLGLEIQDQV